MEKIGKILEKRAPVEAKSRGASYGWQIRALEIATLLGTKKRGDIGQLMRVCRDTPAIVEAVYSWIADVQHVDDPVRLFWWKYWAIKKRVASMGRQPA
jgi:hypothetical protein